jgi:CHAT domain-containing protein/tetratricopeptide (TPR) repeat protein
LKARERVVLCLTIAVVSFAPAAAFPGESEIPTLLAQGAWQKAEQQARELMAGIQSNGTLDGEDGLRAMSLLAEALWRGGKFKDPEARDLADRAVTLSSRLHGEEDPRFAKSLALLGNIDQAAGNFPSAKTLFEKALAIRRRTLPPDSLEVADSLVNVGLVQDAMGNGAAATRSYREALAIQEKGSGDAARLAVAGTLNNLAKLAYQEGDFIRAREQMERTIAIREELQGPEHPDVARVKSNIVGVIINLGDYAGAERFARESLALKEKTIGPDHPQVASSLAQLGRVLYLQGKTAEAIPNLRRAVAIQEKALGPDHPKLALNLNNLALLLQETGDLSGARALLDRAVLIEEKALGSNHPELAESLDSLGGVMLQSGDLKGAHATLERAFQIFDRALGSPHPLVGKAHLNLAEAMWVQGESEQAFAESLLGDRLLREQFDRTARELSEHEALRYEASRLAGLDLSASILFSTRDGAKAPGTVRQLWDELVRSRAKVLGEMAARRRTATRSSDPDVARLTEALDGARRRLAAMVVQGPSSRPDQYKDELARATEERDKAERDLAASSVSLRGELDMERAGFADLERALPRRAALVSYVAYNRIVWKHSPAGPELVRASTPSYAALVLRPDGVVRLQDLGAASVIEERVASWRAEVSKPPNALSGPQGVRMQAQWNAGVSLRQAIWDPVASDVRNASAIFWVPDGALHLVNLDALPGERGRYLLESLPPLHLLVTERSLVQKRPARSPVSRALLVGGPSFDLPASEAASKSDLPARRSAITCARAGALHFDPIPGSLDEIREIEEVLRSARGAATGAPPARALTGSEATERALREMVPGHEILHLATHAFFFDEACESSLTRASILARQGTRADVSSIPAIAESPMMLAGLALAGANRPGDPSFPGDDGVLTAEEIPMLDLSGVEWVVLSGCETGLGRIQSGEGVLGLQRAFEVAGAGTVIMSLWNIGDDATRSWMRPLYEARLDGKGAGDAVRAASQAVLKSLRRDGRSTHPFYWGAFVAAGDWR